MKFGVSMFATDTAILPAELAKAVEERGFESLFFPEHTHIPASRQPKPPRPGWVWRQNPSIVLMTAFIGFVLQSLSYRLCLYGFV